MVSTNYNNKLKEETAKKAIDIIGPKITLTSWGEQPKPWKTVNLSNL